MASNIHSEVVVPLNPKMDTNLVMGTCNSKPEHIEGFKNKPRTWAFCLSFRDMKFNTPLIMTAINWLILTRHDKSWEQWEHASM